MPKLPARAAPTSKGRKRNTLSAKPVPMSEAAQLLGVSTTTLKSWRDQGCPGILSGGATNVGAVMEWEASRREAAAAARYAAADGDKELDKDHWEAMEVRERVISRQIANEKEAGRIIMRDDALDMLTRQINQVRVAMDTMENEWSDRFAPAMSTDRAADLLGELREWMFDALNPAACLDKPEDGTDDGDDDV